MIRKLLPQSWNSQSGACVNSSSSKYEQGPQTILLIAPFSHEDPEEIALGLERQALEIGLNGPFFVMYHPLKLKLLSPGSTIVTDSLVRLCGGSHSRVPTVITQLIEFGVNLIVPGVINLKTGDVGSKKIEVFIKALTSVPKELRSARIRQSLSLRRKQGYRLGRRPISKAIHDRVLQEAITTPAVRTLTRRLQQQGLQISVTSVGRICRKKTGSAT